LDFQAQGLPWIFWSMEAVNHVFSMILYFNF
jgi:hypothetical protein